MTTISKLQQMQGLSQAARQLIDAAMASGTGSYFDADDPDHDTAVQEMLTLNRAVHESAEIGPLERAAPVLSRAHAAPWEAFVPVDIERTGPPDGHLAAPTGPIEIDKAYERFEFNPEGPGLAASQVSDAEGVGKAYHIGQLYGASGHDDEETDEIRRALTPRFGGWARADAVRHAATSFEVAQKLGAQRAKELGDSYERSRDGGPAGDRLMDLHNNRVGRLMAWDSRFAGMTPLEAAEHALRQGWLVIRPYEVNRP